MRELKKEIKKILEDVCPRVFFEEAAGDTPSPYLVYNFSQSVENEGQLLLQLDGDVGDRNSSSANVDALRKKLRALDRTSHIDDEMQLTIYHDRTLNTKSESKNWKRKTVIFNLKYMERS